jgi:hypothetical protein
VRESVQKSAYTAKLQTIWEYSLLVSLCIHDLVNLLLLFLLHFDYSLVDCLSDTHPTQIRLFVLPNAKHSTEGLLFRSRIPPRVDHDYLLSHGEIQSHCVYVSPARRTWYQKHLHPPQRSEAKRTRTSSFSANSLSAFRRAANDILPVYYGFVSPGALPRVYLALTSSTPHLSL